MSFNLEDILKSLEEEPQTEKTAEEPKTEEPKTEEPKEEIKTAEEPKVEEPKVDEDAEKVAALVEEGQIIARAFMSELEKLAVGDGPMTPNTGAVKDQNQLHHVSTEDIQMGDVDKVTAILASLGGHVQDKEPGKIQVTGTEAPKPANAVDEKPLPADAMKAQQQGAAVAALNKSAADKIISNLYKKFFKEE